MDWNDQKYTEIWRQGWAGTTDRYLEIDDRPKWLDLRSYARRGIVKIKKEILSVAFCSCCWFSEFLKANLLYISKLF